MRALVKTAPEPGLELSDVPEPAMGINDVRIRVHKTGICGTDLHVESWDPWAAKTINAPLIVGHEFVGEIPRSEASRTISSSATSSAVRATSSAADAVIAGPVAGTCAPSRSGWASAAMERSRSRSSCR